MNLAFARLIRQLLAAWRQAILLAPWLLCMISALLSPSAQAGTTNAGVTVGPPPAWVQVFTTSVPVADEKKPDPSGGRYLLVDKQLRITPAGEDGFFHYAERVESAAALENVANIEIGFNPAYQHLTIHSADVIRNGVVIHKLDPLAINVLQRERDLEHLIYDGRKTASIFLKDVRVGDTVEYCYTRTGANPVFENLASGTFDLQWGVPIEELHARLLVANNHHLLLHQRNVTLAIAESDTPGYHEYAWTEHSVKALHVASNTPDFYDPYAALDFSEYRDWHDVAAWANRVFQQAAKGGPLMHAEVARISAEYPDDAGRLLATLRFVQGQIRYLGVEIGPGSQAPNSPETVLTRRFGDCKDKALLLVTMLREMGIHADAALVNPDIGESMIDQQPSPDNFSHSIVHVNLKGQELWLDATWDTQLADLGHLVQPRYGYALLIRPDTTDLTRIAEQASSTRRELVRVRIDSSAGFDQPVVMSVETTSEGLSADRTRRFLATHSKDEAQRSFLNFYKGYYSNISTAEPFTVDDSPGINRVIMKEQYRIADFWPAYDDKKHEASFYVMGLKRELHQPDEPIRSSPLSIGEKFDFTESTEVVLPRTFHFSPEHDHIADPAFDLEHFTENGDHMLRLSTRFIKRATFVTPDRIDAYAANAEKAYNASRFELFDGSSSTATTTTTTTTTTNSSNAPLTIASLAPLWLVFTILLVIPVPGRVARALQATTLVDVVDGGATRPLNPSSAMAANAPKVWDPGHAAILSLFFSTAFGAILVGRNWTELGERRRARQSYAIAIVELLNTLSEIVTSSNHESRPYYVLGSLALLLGWYLLDARPQQMRLRTGLRVMRRFWPNAICYGLLYSVGWYVAGYWVVDSQLFSRWPL